MHYPSNGQLLKLLFYMIFSGLISITAAYISWVDMDTTTPPLKDYFMDRLPDMSNSSILLPNIMLNMAVAILLLVVLYRRNLSLLCRYFFLQSTIQLLRAMAVCVTTFPDIHAIDSCATTTPKNWGDMFIKYIEVGTCGDYMFSGHVAFTTIVMMMLIFEGENMIVSGIGILINIVQFFVIVSWHWHYSADAVIAIYIGIFLCLSYYFNPDKKSRWFYFINK